MRLVMIANARLPSERAQSLQVVQMAAAFERAGASTLLLHARRTHTAALPPGQDLCDYYGVPAGARPAIESVRCIDWIDRLPRKLQFAPARLQELSFARAAARRAAREAGARVYSREIESARALVKRRHPAVFLELHRVPQGRARRRWLAETAPGLAGLVAISGGVRADLAELGLPAERLCVEHDAVEAARFASAPTRAQARERLRIPAAASVVVYTGGLLEWKGVDVLVEAARELPQVLFVIAGGMGADVERLRTRAAGASNVRIDGFQPPARVPEYLAAADLGVVPNRAKPEISARYTSPLKVFECLAMGLPLVVSDLPSLRDILGPEDAVFAPPDDARALAAAIGALLADAGLRARLSARARARAPGHSWDARAERLLRWMESRRGSDTR